MAEPNGAPEEKSVEGTSVKATELPLKPMPPEEVLDWATALSAEERGWVDATYRPPMEVKQLVERLKRTSRSFYVLTGLWGVGKSSALQFLHDALCESVRVYLLRLAPDRSILDQMIADDILNFGEYRREIIRRLEARHKLGRLSDGAYMEARDAAAGIRPSGPGINEMPLPKATYNEIQVDNAVESLVMMDNVFLDLPDFSRADRRSLLRVLNQVQDLWLRVMKSGRENIDTPIGPNFVTTLQKELSDLAPSYFLGKANTVEIKPLPTQELVDAYKAKFATLEPFDESSLTFIAELSRGIFRRFLKFMAATLQDAHQRGDTRIGIEDATYVLDPKLVAREMEPELASLFPRAEVREKAFRIIYELLLRKFDPNEQQRAADPLVRDYRSGPVSQKRLAEALSFTESDVSRIVDRLAANRIISRERTDEGNILHLA
jgi:hypothetical protein